MPEACGASCAMAGAPPDNMERTALGTAAAVPETKLDAISPPFPYLDADF